MMYITYLRHDSMIEEKEWHIGEDLVMPAESKVLEVQVDSDELQYITQHFFNMPVTNANKRIVRYPPPWAEFIVLNMDSKYRRTRGTVYGTYEGSAESIDRRY